MSRQRPAQYHPYQRTSLRQSTTDANPAPVPRNRPLTGADSTDPPRSVFAASTSAFFKPDASTLSKRPTFANSIGPSDDIYGEFNHYMTRRELLRSAAGKDKHGQSTASSNELLKSTASSSTNASLDLYSDPELIRARKEIRELKSARRKLTDEKAAFERNIHDLEKSGHEKETKLQEAMLRVDQLEVDRQFLVDRNKDLTERLGDAEENMIDWKKDADMTQNILKRQIAELRDQLSLSKRDSDAQLRKAQLENDRVESVVHQMEQQVADLQNELTKQANYIKSGREQLTTAERQYREAEATIRKLQANGSVTEEMVVLKRQLTEQTAHIRSLETKMQELAQQNRYLRNMQENTEKLKDEKEHLVQQLSRMSQIQNRADALVVELNALKAERQRWTEFLTEHDDIGVDSPYALAKTLAQQRLELAILKEKYGQEEANRKGRAAHLERLERELEESQAKVSESEKQRQADLRTYKRLERSRQLAQKEVEFLREQLRSYDLEEEHNSVPGAYDTQKSERIRKLEEIVDEYRLHVKSLEDKVQLQERQLHQQQQPTSHLQPSTSSLSSLSSSSASSQQSSASSLPHATQALVTQLQTENTQLKKQLEQVEIEAHTLSRALGRGEHDPRTTRVLELADNPERAELRIRQATLDALCEENRKLVEQCRTSNANNNSSSSNGSNVFSSPLGSAAAVPVESLRSVQLECSQLKAQMEEKDKRAVRLKEAYQLKAQEYREAVYSLLGVALAFFVIVTPMLTAPRFSLLHHLPVGYNLEIEMDGRVRLTSTYASSSSTTSSTSPTSPTPHYSHSAHSTIPSFVFASGDGDRGTVQLVGGGGGGHAHDDPLAMRLEHRVHQAMQYYLDERGSVPAFLAGVTLLLFERAQPTDQQHQQQQNQNQLHVGHEMRVQMEES
ncbi:mitotic checkpoint protein-domain-containing protein [Powellomyces hirtus]|nr:mitotic checkpoint protein-domain-containing protein [Powellomyces hirtus]